MFVTPAHPPKKTSFVEALVPQMMLFSGGAFGGHQGWDPDGISVLLSKGRGQSFLLLRHGKTAQKGSHLRAGGGSSPEADHAGTLTLDFRPQNSCFSHFITAAQADRDCGSGLRPGVCAC